MKLSKKLVLASISVVAAMSICTSAALADETSTPALEKSATYSVTSSVSCPVVAGPVNADFGSGLVTNTVITTSEDGSPTCTLTLGTTTGTIMNVPYTGFVSAVGPSTTILNGYMDYGDNNAWKPATTTLSTATYSGQNASGEAAELNAVETFSFPLTSAASNSYELALYINNGMRPYQFGGSDNKYTATLTIDWSTLKLVEKKEEAAPTPALTKATNTLSLGSKSKTISAKKLKKKARSFTIKTLKAQGKVSFSSKSKKVKITAKGKVTVKKGTKKGTRIIIAVKAAGNSSFLPATKYFTVKIK